MLQRIIYISLIGERHDIILEIIKKKSKVIVCRNPEDDSMMDIPRHSVIEILPAKIEKDAQT
jgi:hypothetical protein